MIRHIVFIIAFVLLSSFSLSAEEISLTLQEAQALALRGNRDILLSAEDIKKAKAKIQEAQSGLFPSLDFTGSWTDTRGFYLKDKTGINPQATLKQYIYRGGEVINTIKYNEHGLTAAQALLDKTRLEVALNVQKAFFTLLLAREFANLNKKILDNVKEHLVSLEARYQNGEVSRSDILKIKRSLADIEEAYAVSLNEIESGSNLLKNLLYMDEAVKIAPDGQFVYEPKEVAFDEAFLETMKRRPEIRQFEAKAKQAKNAIEIAKADSRPNIYASWDYYSSSLTQLTFSPSHGWNDYNVVGVTFTWPIFDGFATKAKVEQAIVGLKEAELAKQKLINDIALELKNAYISLKNAIDRIRAAESDLAVYKDNLLSIKQRHREGIASFLDLNDANLSYDISLFNKNEAIYDYIVARLSFEKATGGL
jgi:outer membrane protein